MRYALWLVGSTALLAVPGAAMQRSESGSSGGGDGDLTKGAKHGSDHEGSPSGSPRSGRGRSGIQAEGTSRGEAEFPRQASDLEAQHTDHHHFAGVHEKQLDESLDELDRLSHELAETDDIQKYHELKEKIRVENALVKFYMMVLEHSQTKAGLPITLNHKSRHGVLLGRLIETMEKHNGDGEPDAAGTSRGEEAAAARRREEAAKAAAERRDATERRDAANFGKGGSGFKKGFLRR